MKLREASSLTLRCARKSDVSGLRVGGEVGDSRLRMGEGAAKVARNRLEGRKLLPLPRGGGGSGKG